MPRSIAFATTSRVPARSSRPPKLLQPSPMTETLGPFLPITRVSTVRFSAESSVAYLRGFARAGKPRLFARCWRGCRDVELDLAGCIAAARTRHMAAKGDEADHGDDDHQCADDEIEAAATT